MPVDPRLLSVLPSGRRVMRAQRTDVPGVVALLADDLLGANREGRPDDPAYAVAFDRIQASGDHLLVVVREGEGRAPDGADGGVLATMQITLLPGLSRRGALRAQIEAVRVAGAARGSGLGRELFEWAIGWCREQGACLVQLTTDKSRPDAHRFYERLGFVASHEGMKLPL